jgi:hypothetical protein
MSAVLDAADHAVDLLMGRAHLGDSLAIVAGNAILTGDRRIEIRWHDRLWRRSVCQLSYGWSLS